MPRERASQAAQKRLRVLPNWPAMSPDLNPVEHCWAWLAQQMSGQAFASADALWEGLQREWAKFPPAFIHLCMGRWSGV